MSSSEVMGVGVSAFSFTLHSYLVRITGRMSLKCSSLSFSVTSSLIFYTLIRWILHLWLDVRPEGHQQGARAIPDVVVLDVPFCPEPDETGWSILVAVKSWSRLLSWSLPLPLEPCPTLLPHLLDLSPCRASLRHWPKSHPSAMSASGSINRRSIFWCSLLMLMTRNSCYLRGN
jgi:hypothetical protein